jgi:hypothetical protein
LLDRRHFGDTIARRCSEPPGDDAVRYGALPERPEVMPSKLDVGTEQGIAGVLKRHISSISINWQDRVDNHVAIGSKRDPRQITGSNRNDENRNDAPETLGRPCPFRHGLIGDHQAGVNQIYAGFPRYRT